MDCLIAEGKLKEAERLEERQTGKSAELGISQSGGQRRSSVKKIERLMEKVIVLMTLNAVEEVLSCSQSLLHPVSVPTPDREVPLWSVYSSTLAKGVKCEEGHWFF